tara:strand:- start:1617 stop:1790 length:174 start_codon:yes stop_codon:yes gene_type:complete
LNIIILYNMENLDIYELLYLDMVINQNLEEDDKTDEFHSSLLYELKVKINKEINKRR